MSEFIKYYSYNQIAELYDVLIMSLEQYQQVKDKLDNPQVVVCVNREGGPKPPNPPKWFQYYKKETNERFEKIEEQLNGSNPPKWFQSYKKETNERFEKIEEQLNGSNPPKWFQSYKKETNERFEKIEEQLNGSNPPKWFTSYMEGFGKRILTIVDEKFKSFAKLNNLKYEE